jgi:hypothetical protein
VRCGSALRRDRVEVIDLKRNVHFLDRSNAGIDA